MPWLGRRLGEMSERQLADTVRFWTMSISDFLDEYFESPVIKGYLAVSAIIGTALGPMSPGSGYARSFGISRTWTRATAKWAR